MSVNPVSPNKMKSSILDFPRKSLPTELWDYSQNKDDLPRLNEDLKKVILSMANEHLEQFSLPLKGVLLYGGSASYQWSPGSDVDVSVYVDWGESAPEVVEKVQEHFKNQEVDFAGHPVHLFVKGPDQSDIQIEVSDAVYDVLNGEWVLPPLVLPQDFDPDEYFKPFIKEAERKAKRIDEKIGELRRSWAILKKASQAEPEARDASLVQERILEEKAKVRSLVKELALDFWNTRKRRYALHDTLREKIKENVELGRFERFQEPEVVWKYLDRAGYNDILWELYKIYSGGTLESILARF